MGSISDYGENALVGHVCGSAYTPEATVYLTLSTADPTDDASGLAEPDDTAYARQSISFDAAASRKVVQAADVSFPTFNGDGAGGDVSHWAIMDAETGGDMLAHGSMSQSFSIIEGLEVVIAAGEVEVEITSVSGYGFVDYLVHNLLDLMFRDQSFAQPDTYIALCTATVSNSDTSITEEGGSGYSRVQLNKAGGSSPAWSSVSDGATDNADEVSWTPSADDWTEVVAMAILDAATDGNLLAFDNDNVVNQTPGDGETTKFSAGALSLSLS